MSFVMDSENIQEVIKNTHVVIKYIFCRETSSESTYGHPGTHGFKLTKTIWISPSVTLARS